MEYTIYQRDVCPGMRNHRLHSSMDSLVWQVSQSLKFDIVALNNHPWKTQTVIRRLAIGHFFDRIVCWIISSCKDSVPITSRIYTECNVQNGLYTFKICAILADQKFTSQQTSALKKRQKYPYQFIWLYIRSITEFEAAINTIVGQLLKLPIFQWPLHPNSNASISCLYNQNSIILATHKLPYKSLTITPNTVSPPTFQSLNAL